MLKKVTPHRLLLLFILIYFVIGIFVAGDYGASIDHSQETDRAEIALRRYAIPDRGDPVGEYLSLGINQYYGTAQMSIFLLVENALQPVLSTPRYDILHFMFFASFLMGIYAIYFLAKRWLNEWTSLAVALLFGLQPLFFGHSFINPKDIPIMSFFIVAIVLGFRMADKLEAAARPEPGYFQRLSRSAWEEWGALPKRRRRWLLVLLWTWIILLAFWIFELYKPTLEWLLTALYTAPESSLLGKFFRTFAASADSASLEIYLQIYLDYAILYLPKILTVTGLLWLAVYLWQVRGTVVQFFRDVPKFQPGPFFRRVWRNLFSFHFDRSAGVSRDYWLAAVIAGLMWGLSISVRATNIVAGGMIGLYLLLKLRGRSVLPLLVFTLSGLIGTLATWPYLWHFGLQGFLDGMAAFSDYPWEEGRVWLRGVIPIDEIPSTYLLHTMAIQFTEPIVILSILGMGLSLARTSREKIPGLDLFILLSWFWLPNIYTATAHPTLYNNFRQFMFVTPPLFIFSGLMIEWVRKKLNNTLIFGLLVVLLLTPGIIETIRLHPYQYTYYNQFVGGVEGAAGQYELDYWSVTYKEVIEYINETAPPNARVMIRGSNDIQDFYGRPDIYFEQVKLNTTPEEIAGYDYLVMTTGHRHELEFIDPEEYPTVYEVYGGSTLLAVVKEVNP